MSSENQPDNCSNPHPVPPMENMISMELMTLTEDLKQLRDSETAMHQRIDDLQDQVKRYESKYRALEISYIELTESKYVLETDLESSQKEVTDLNAKHEDLKVTVESLRTLNVQLTTRIEEQECRIKEYDATIGDLRKNLDLKDKTIKELDEERAVRRHEKDSQISEKCKQHEATIKNLQADLQRKDKGIKELNEIQASNIRENSRTKEQYEATIKSLQADVQLKDKLVTELKDKLEQNTKEVAATVVPPHSSSTEAESELHNLLAEQILRQNEMPSKVIPSTDKSKNSNDDDESWRAKVEKQLTTLHEKVEFLEKENLKLQLKGLMSIGNGTATNKLSNLSTPTTPTKSLPMSIQVSNSSRPPQTFRPPPPCNNNNFVKPKELASNTLKPNSAPILEQCMSGFDTTLNGVRSHNPSTKIQPAPPYVPPPVNPESVIVKVGQDLNNSELLYDGRKRRHMPFHAGKKSMSSRNKYTDRQGTNMSHGKPKTAAAGDFFKYQASVAAAKTTTTPSISPLMSIPPMQPPLSKNNPPQDFPPKPQLLPQNIIGNVVPAPVPAAVGMKNSSGPTTTSERQNENPGFSQSPGPPPSSRNIPFTNVQQGPPQASVINTSMNKSVPTQKMYQLLYAKQRLDVSNDVDVRQVMNAVHEENGKTVQAVAMYEHFQHSFTCNAGGNKFVIHFWLTQRMVERGVCIPHQLRVCFPKLTTASGSTVPASYGNCFVKVKFLDRLGLPVCTKIFQVAALNGTCENHIEGPHVNCSQATLSVDNFEFFTTSLNSYCDLKKSAPLTRSSTRSDDGGNETNKFFPLEVELFLMMRSQQEFPINVSKQADILRHHNSKNHKQCWKIPLKIECSEHPYDVEPCLAKAYSPILEKLSEENLLGEKRDKTVTLPGVSQHTIQTFISFIHARQIELKDLTKVLELLNFSFKYLIADLAQICSDRLIQADNEEYQLLLALEVMAVGYRFGNSELQDRAKKWLRMNSPALQTEEGKRIMAQFLAKNNEESFIAGGSA